MEHDHIDAALHAINYDACTTADDGTRIAESSNPVAIEEMLRIADIRPGDRVLEIGTGSGYTCAVLARLVGEAGTIVTVDIDPELSDRAKRMQKDTGNIVFIAGDGMLGAPNHGPFDRVIAWTTPHVIPVEWIEQCVPGARLACPVKVAELATANGIITAFVNDEGGLDVLSVASGGYIEMTVGPNENYGLPVQYVDSAYVLPDSQPWWVSAGWLRNAHAQAFDLVEALRVNATVETSPLAEDEIDSFTGWLLATGDPSVTTAGLGEKSNAIGISDATGSAVLSFAECIRTGDDNAYTTLAAYIGQWRLADWPGWDDLAPVTVAVAEGYAIRLRHSR